MQYRVTACQLAVESCFDELGNFRPAQVRRNVEHAREVVVEAYREAGSRLFVLPQFTLQGFTPGRTIADWCGASVRIPGPEVGGLGQIAREVNGYLVGTAFEVLDEFPGRHFLTGFVLAPSGEVILRYRKLYAFSTKTRPTDVYSQYVDMFGRSALFPVVQTPLGKLGVAIAGDVHWPEMTRALAMRGAEVILNPTGAAFQSSDAVTALPYIRRVRAFENISYMVLANVGPLRGPVPLPSERLRSEIVDFEGRVLASAATDEETTVTATIDLERLHRQRAQPMKNYLAQLQSQLHAPDYAEAALWGLDQWKGRPLSNPDELVELEQRISAELSRAGSCLP